MPSSPKSVQTRIQGPSAKPEDTLTPREFEAVQLMVSGLTGRQAGAKMGILEDTVKKHIVRAMRKTGSDNRVMLAVWFVRKFKTEASEQEYLQRSKDAKERRLRQLFTFCRPARMPTPSSQIESITRWREGRRRASALGAA
jgi:DNA-binding CsgD family transcriptional regulator